MKGSPIILALFGISGSFATVFWEDGKEYHFVEESAVHVGTNDLVSSVSGVRMMSDVKVQVSGKKLVVSIENVKEAHFNHPYTGGWSYRLAEEKVKDPMSKYIPSVGYENGNTFSMDFVNGMVTNIELPSSLSVNGKNMMRALASILQIDTEEHEIKTWSKNEGSIHGQCEVQYTFLNMEKEHHMEMTKSVSHVRDCTKRNFKLFDNSDAHSCNFVKEDALHDHEHAHKHKMTKMHHTEPIHSNSMTTFQLKEVASNKFQIEKIFSAGAVVVQRFSEAGPTHVTLANRTLTLVEVNSAGSINSVENPQTYNDLEFEWTEGKVDWNNPLTTDDLKAKESFFYNGYTIDEPQSAIMEALKDQIMRHAEELIDFHDPDYHQEETIRKLQEHSMQSVLPFFHALDYNSLTTLKSYYLNMRTDDQLKKSARDIFFEMLPVCGTWPAALVVKDIVMNNELKSDIETAKIVTSVPFHVEPVKAIAEEFFKLVTSNAPHLKLPFTKSAVDLSYAHLVRKTCHELDTKQDCFKILHVDEFVKRFDALTIDDHTNLQHLMLVFNNFRGSDVLEYKLKDIVFKKTPKKYDDALRTQAVFALAYNALHKGIEQEYFLPIFLSKDESHEVRIAAFDTIMRGASTATTFNKILTYMIYETDHEVFNYVYTAFEKFAVHNYNPCRENVHSHAKYFIKYWKQHMWQKPKYGFGVSKTYATSFKNDEYAYSGSVDVHTIGSHETTSPLSIMADMRSQRFHHMSMGVFAGFIRMEGVADGIVENFKNLFFNGKFEFEKLKQILFTNMKIKKHENAPAKVDFVLMMRDTVVFEYHIHDTNMNNFVVKMKEFFNMLQKYQGFFNGNKHFGLSWEMFLYEQPTDFGVPMAYVSGANTIAGLFAETRKEAGLNGDVDVQLQIMTDHSDLMTVIHPDQSTMFTIQQKRNFKQQMKSSVTVDVDINARKLTVAVKIPERKSPFSMLAHSQTFTYTQNNKIAASQIYLKKSCPTCSMKNIVSHGEGYRRNSDLLKPEIKQYLKIYGMDVKANIFDCEMPEALSPGQQFYSILRSFNPITTEPKSLFHSVFNGIRRFHTFFFFFPKVESCGTHFFISQAAMEPVEELIVDIDLNRFQYIDHPNKLYGEKSFALNGDIIFSGHVNRTHHFKADFAIAPMWRKSHFDFEIIRKPFTYLAMDYPAYPINFHMRTKYFGVEPPFHFSDIKSVEQHKVHSSMELVWGNQEQRIQIEAEHKNTAEAMNQLHNTWYYKTCLKEHAQQDRTDSASLLTSDACFYTLHDLYTLRHYKWTVSATGLSPAMVSAYKKLGTMAKGSMFPFWEFKPEYTTHEVAPRQPTIRIEQIFHRGFDTVDITLQVDKDVSVFKDVNYGFFHIDSEPYQSLSKMSLLTKSLIQPEMMIYMYYNNILNHCDATSQDIRTYDNVTYPYTMDHSCYSLISSDCGEHPTFAVFAKKIDEAHIGLMAFIGNEKIEFIPFDNEKINVKVNDVEYVMHDGAFLYVPENETPVTNKVVNNHLFKIIHKQKTFSIMFFPQILINYDGKSIQVRVGPHMKGQHCGMCGDYNGMTHQELKNPQMCVLQSGQDMAKAWALDSKFCTETVVKPACV